ncbi:MAG: DVUA0089 family protein, partial [Planctomycetia bacterium]|nr:DVUA0089 family protein [Planctomycetia bacterium]
TPIVKSDAIATDIDVDLYKFTVIAGLVVDFDLNTTQNGLGGVDSYLRLFDSSGRQLAANDNAVAPGDRTAGFDSFLQYTFTAVGTYYIAVSNANNTSYDPVTGNGDTAGGFNTVGSYQLSVSGALPDTDDSIAEAIPLGAISTTPVTKSDSISPDTDVDMYSFTANAGQTVDFDIDTIVNGLGGLDSNVRLFNAQGQQLAFNNNATAPGESILGFDAYLRFTFTTGGTFYVAVSNANNTQYDPTTGSGDTAGGASSTGAYLLTVVGVVLHPTLTLTPAVASIPEFHGTATATVARSNADVSQALVVTLISSNTAAASVPPTITIPAGQLTATFTVTAVDDHVAAGIRNSTITATANGFATGTQLIHVTDSESVWHNTANPFDVNNDTFVTSADALAIINYLNAFGSASAPAGRPPPFYDVDSDSFITPNDVLQVINAINSGAAGEGESAAPVTTANNSAAPSTLSSTLVDAVFAEQTPPTSKRRIYECVR